MTYCLNTGSQNIRKAQKMRNYVDSDKMLLSDTKELEPFV